MLSDEELVLAFYTSQYGVACQDDIRLHDADLVRKGRLAVLREVVERAEHDELDIRCACSKSCLCCWAEAQLKETDDA